MYENMGFHVRLYIEAREQENKRTREILQEKTSVRLCEKREANNRNRCASLGMPLQERTIPVWLRIVLAELRIKAPSAR